MNTPSTPTSTYRLLYFFASWHASHSQISAVFKTLPLLVKGKDVKFQTVDVDTNTTLTSTYSVTIVPTLIYLHNDVVWTRIEEGNPALISRTLVSMTNGSPPPVTISTSKPTNSLPPAPNNSQTNDKATSGDLEVRMKTLTSKSKVFALIKGTSSSPKCGYTRELCELFDVNKIAYTAYDILEDPELREFAKAHYGWPTYPMVFADGELVGGLDVVKEINEEGKLRDELGLKDEDFGDVKTEENVRDRIDRIIGSGKVVVFMKGIPSEPKCGFSRKICELLTPALGDSGYTTYNILEDQPLRSEIKAYKEWPTFPQVYVKGELVGGLDVVRDMIEDGEFEDVVNEE